MSNAGPPDAKPPSAGSEQPLIPESTVDAPSQRLYIISIGVLCQAIKVFDWIYSLVVDPTTNLTLKWILVDVSYCLVLKRLRIPKLNYAPTAVILQIIILCLINGVLFGTVHVGVSSYSLSSSARDFYRKEMSTSGHMVNLRDLFSHDDHLKGEHTVRMSPTGTAKLNPEGHAYCLSTSANMVLIPVLLNNTTPSHIRYSVIRLGSDKVDYVDVNAKELRSIEQQRLEALQMSKASASAENEYSDVDWDPEDEDSLVGQDRLIGFSQELEKTQSVVHLKVNKPGIIRLERVLDASTSNIARIFHSEVPVVPCPQASFVPDNIMKGNAIRCIGSKEELSIRVSGVPPLSLNWHRDVNGRREHFSVDRMEGEPDKQGQVHELPLPLDMPLHVSGIHEYVLDSISDGLGNIESLTPTSLPRKGDPRDPKARLLKETTRSVTVLKRVAISFRDCAPGKPASLLIGSETSLIVSAREFDKQDGPWDIKIQFRPNEDAKRDRKAPKPWVKTLSTPAEKNHLTISASAPGEYSIVDVKGQYCPGDILSPDSCRVLLQPLPAAEITWKRIHECSGDTGVSAYLVLHGKPPFQVFYQQKRNDEQPKEMSRSFQGSRGEIVLQPENSGNYTYTFTYLSDANYQRVKLDGPSITQVVHPLASASFANVGGGGRRSINSCSGNTVGVDVDLRGDGPWKLEVQAVGPKGSETIRLEELKNSREKLQVPIPSDIDTEGGLFQIDLVSVEDSYGCRKDLAVPGISVNVRRVKPSVRFYAKDGKRETTVLEGDEAGLPLRLTGEGPWRVKYQLSDSHNPIRTATLRSPNDLLAVRERGTYRLIEVSDAQCPGSIIESEADYKVEWIPRPSVRLSPDTAVVYHRHNGSHVHAPVCEGQEDHVDLEVTGRAPFEIGYNVATRNEAGGTRILDQPTISSIHSRARIQLYTSQPGRMYYEVKQVGDANYPVKQNRAHVIPRQERLLFEQEVIGRPSAQFKKQTRLTHCLGDSFAPTDLYSMDDMIALEGKPPFHLDLSVKDLATGEVHRQTVELWTTQWKINLPNYIFTSIGPHLVTIESVRDATSCMQAIPDPMKTSIWVDVAESAAIVPFDRREHFCVGDVTQFQLEGTPPWMIGYKVGSKSHEQVVNQSPFALVHQHPGPFSITSVSHQQQQCKTSVDNINFQVHALPAAQVAQGRDFFEDIHEGSQAQIVFTLVGEPPFTFTYQRSEPPQRKGAKPGRVLETHTVSGVMSHEYSIYSALEGTWTVTFISDKYCRYPPAQPDNLADQKRS